MTLRERKPRLWVEFSEGFGPKIALNSTGFHHSHLFFDYARAYRKAARQLFEQYWQAEDFQDMDMHPIVFLYRHAVEVYLKTILSLGNGVLLINRKPLRTGAKIFNGHKLRPMLPGIGRQSVSVSLNTSGKSSSSSHSSQQCGRREDENSNGAKTAAIAPAAVPAE
jgi:hypothetical protein